MAKPKPKKAATKKATAKVPADFIAPDWGNVRPPPIAVVPTGDAAIDEALAKRIAHDTSPAVVELAERTPASSLIAMFRGPALDPGRTYWDLDVVRTLSSPKKKQQKAVYWEVQTAKDERELLIRWFAKQLAKTPEGRAHLVTIAAGDHPAFTRNAAADALRDGRPDAALLRAIACALDPAAWVGAVTRTMPRPAKPVSSTAAISAGDLTPEYLGRTYSTGALAAVAIDPAAAHARFSPLLAPRTVWTEQAIQQVYAIAWGVRLAISDCGVDPEACAAFRPLFAALVTRADVAESARSALAVLS